MSVENIILITIISVIFQVLYKYLKDNYSEQKIDYRTQIRMQRKKELQEWQDEFDRGTQQFSQHYYVDEKLIDYTYR